MQMSAGSGRDSVSVRSLLVLGAAVIMIITGLLGMHTLSGSPSGHVWTAPGLTDADGHHDATVMPAAMLNDASSTQLGALSGIRSGLSMTTVASSAVPTGPVQHDAMMLTCVLALLSGLLLLAAPLLRTVVLPLAWHRMAHASLTVTSARPRPPSLAFLSISRT